MDWIELLEGTVRWWTLVNAVMNFRVPLNAVSFMSVRGNVSCPRRTLLRGIC